MFLQWRNEWYSQSQNKPRGIFRCHSSTSILYSPQHSSAFSDTDWIWHRKRVWPFSFEFNFSKIAWISSDRNHRTIKMADAEIISHFLQPVSWGIKQCIQQDYFFVKVIVAFSIPLIFFWIDTSESLAPDITVIRTSSTNYVAEHIHATLLKQI